MHQLLAKTMLPRDAQLSIENTFSRKAINKMIRKDLESSNEVIAKVSQGVKLVNKWMSKEFYPKKQARVDQLNNLDIELLVMDIFIVSCVCQTEELFTSIAGMTASKLGFDYKADGIHTAAELLAVLCETDFYDIFKSGQSGSLYVKCNWQLDSRIITYIQQSKYLPPLVVKPRKISKTGNRTNSYLTMSDSLILNNNHHRDPIATDVIDTQNRVELSLDKDFLCSVDEVPNKELDTVAKREAWDQHVKQSREMYRLLLDYPKIYQDNKYDKRGRLYCSGYHVCLLYTSPSPRDATLSRMPSSA